MILDDLNPKLLPRKESRKFVHLSRKINVFFDLEWNFLFHSRLI